ncbi:bifunctional methylenetetrahydrofolate dehydrogenase/methenyltetrahydrofolate cyclohydrolase FolD [Legionella jordanis]|uniref:Bifunctional protein FolD n=1 Tax=Legionella jordanis TaxID=456 RepID=A0A0W0V7W4_9GAMM|nr:bifunctional methylenetetrahydrofolate dehydrogenase/methenyltetrahydrofolate cyclohydrolase FolD [Legionella jordanis]KTD16206.1 Bifunctional Methylenetetrahydrofolate dehydrogenase/Methenyltetrahydrofolate cyclohydrolase FolD [Legionella jordanis]RMX04573.1 bifunctional methylenetetrahydrofolate dehydrogenase/methenyltetrahydrofolate cyclohydrolase FolD [Legionella jordanis]RMX21119.1 bifunctional methylenetetrahydrofolate dehydrogenase/methenyltetrahydrofolate cyclohydrolase FolD [Legionel
MTASLLDGKLVSEAIKQEIKTAVGNRLAEGKRAPGLAAILVGSDPASGIYVRNKRKACLEVGFQSFAYDLPSSTTEKELLKLISELNQSPEIDGILVQLPLPDHINPNKILECIAPHKDIDGFHPYNVGRLALRNPLLRPCTPYGIINLLDYYQIPLEGKHSVVIGASNIVGRPMAMEFLLAAATVSICHRFTIDLERYVRMADILVVATGIPDVIDVNWLHKDQIIIDVGIHRLPNGKLRGDVDFERARKIVSWITPVPGGVGPMTIAILLQNTLFAASQLSSGLLQGNCLP